MQGTAHQGDNPGALEFHERCGVMPSFQLELKYIILLSNSSIINNVPEPLPTDKNRAKGGFQVEWRSD